MLVVWSLVSAPPPPLSLPMAVSLENETQICCIYGTLCISMSFHSQSIICNDARRAKRFLIAWRPQFERDARRPNPACKGERAGIGKNNSHALKSYSAWHLFDLLSSTNCFDIWGLCPQFVESFVHPRCDLCRSCPRQPAGALPERASGLHL
jgi:hypothetical protein